MKFGILKSTPRVRQVARLALATAAAATVSLGATTPAWAWEPQKPVEFIVPAGTGGGADQMARLIQGIIVKHKLMKESMVVINKSGGAGAEGFLDVKGSSGDPHKIIITLSNLFTTPMATGVPFNWKEMTPVTMMALDQFVLWVNAETPYKTPKDYVDAVKAAGPNKMKMGGTGSKQEDQIITVGLEKATGTKFIYVPFKGGGEVAVQLVGKHIDSTVNNPIEAVAQWRAGKLRPLCVFDDQRMPYKQKITDTMSWNDIPTCKESGIPTDYVMLRGIFMAPGVTPEQQAYYVDLMKKVRETPDWKEFMEKGAFNTTAIAGADFVKWLTNAELNHRQLMTEAGFIAK
jgi:putative tricarboxylic transport membrane protein